MSSVPSTRRMVQSTLADSMARMRPRQNGATYEEPPDDISDLLHQRRGGPSTPLPISQAPPARVEQSVRPEIPLPPHVGDEEDEVDEDIEEEEEDVATPQPGSVQSLPVKRRRISRVKESWTRVYIVTIPEDERTKYLVAGDSNEKTQ
ncbi:hypothetical protein HDU99_000616, partial [Rhizoclosmatium hyalinum]